MSILDCDKIDMLATRPGSNVVKLVITDHVDWSDLEEHYRMLQDKINAYLGFIDSGQLRRVPGHPLPDAPELFITLASATRPPSEAYGFFEQVKAFLLAQGIKFEVEVRPL